DNPYIVLQHLPCAAYEHPLRPEEPLFTGVAFDVAVSVLAEDGTLTPYHDCHRYTLSDYPAKGVNLRGMTDYNVEIVHDGVVIGEIDPIGARGTLYKDAIYQHLGKRYMSVDLDLEKKLCQVETVQVDYYTEAVWENRIVMTEELEDKALQDAPLKFGYVHVNKQPKLYKKIRERTYENVGYGPITLDAFEYDTTGLSLLPPRDWGQAADQVDKRYLGAALFGLSYLLRRTATSLCMADVADIETDVSLHEEEHLSYKSSLYLYDQHEGGVGYTEKIYERIDDALALCRAVIDACPCRHGCPACVPPLPPGVESEEMEQLLVESNAAVACTVSLLTALIDGVVALPEIVVLREHRTQAVQAPGEDEETLRLTQRLNHAAKILRRKREREH
ncbi:MAG: DUF1998 domain-containing protein, partial [Lentisphaeria bacterium]|nr:DUF1998 domain-containing protein [Lentisphaeria bacterium]